MQVKATIRQAQTQGEKKKRKRQGFVPGAVFGKGLQSTLVEVTSKDIATILNSAAGLNTVIDLKVGDSASAHTVLVADLDRDPVTRRFRHVGFHEVQKGEKVTAHIRVNLIGEPVGVSIGGGVLEQIAETIAVIGLPGDLPSQLDIDISELQLGSLLRVSDLPHNPKLEFVTGEEQPIAAVQHSKVAASATAADNSLNAAPSGESGTTAA